MTQLELLPTFEQLTLPFHLTERTHHDQPAPRPRRLGSWRALLASLRRRLHPHLLAMTAKTPAERARAARDRKRGGPPRRISDDPLARARRKLNAGARVADLDPAEADAYRTYQAERQRLRRGGTA